MPFRQEFEKVYRKVVEPVLKKCGFCPVRADEIKKSSSMWSNIEGQIQQAGLVIAFPTDASNSNVSIEVGYAMAFQTETILICKDARKIPTDIRHLNHLSYDLNNLSEFKKEFSEWIKNTNAYRYFKVNKKVKKAQPIFERADTRFPHLLDAVFYLSPDVPPDRRSDIAKYIKSDSIIPMKYLYGTERGYRNWLNLCDDPEYEYYRESEKFYAKKSSEIIKVVSSVLGVVDFDFISLGPGNGRKDRLIIKSAVKRLSKGQHLYYYPLDVSSLMLEHAIRTVGHDPHIRENLKIKAIITDFNELAAFTPIYVYRKQPNVFSLLGNTLGNMKNEGDFLRVLQRPNAMLSGDILILEAKLLSNRSTMGTKELNKEFDSTFLFELGIPYCAEKLSYERVNGISAIPNTATVVAKYSEIPLNGNTYKDVSLSCIHEYDYISLIDFLQNNGFEIIREYKEELFATIILKKK
ncbi:MAG: hypothetical protein DRO96_01045 [Candidatus Aenigmatarchaeota archaeon]|nr:MAG: hypothetical protein DRO96_01045 [Candidatus Aenigmarchaeota archaeon]